MRYRLLLMVAFCFFAARATLADATDDAAKIKGAWTVTSATKSGEVQTDEDNKKMKVVIDDNNITISVGGHDEPAAYKLDPSHTPHWIDITAGKDTLPGIYELDKDTLKICFAQGGRDRPTSFEGNADNHYSVLILSRAGAASQPAAQ